MGPVLPEKLRWGQRRPLSTPVLYAVFRQLRVYRGATTGSPLLAAHKSPVTDRGIRHKERLASSSKGC